MTLSTRKSTIVGWDSFRFSASVSSCVALNVHLHLEKKKPVLVCRQMIGETFLSSNVHVSLRQDWSFLQAAVPAASPRFPAWLRSFCTTLHSTLVLREFITWDPVVSKKQKVGWWGLAKPGWTPKGHLLEGYLHLGSFVYNNRVLIGAWVKLFVESWVSFLASEKDLDTGLMLREKDLVR